MELAITKILGIPNGPQENSWDLWVPLSRRGIPKRTLMNYAERVHLSLSDLEKILPISAKTLQRYPKDKILDRNLSGHVVALAKIYVRAVEVFECEEKARHWLKKPNRALGGEIPFTLFDSLMGFQAIQDELERIEYGVYC